MTRLPAIGLVGSGRAARALAAALGRCPGFSRGLLLARDTAACRRLSAETAFEAAGTPEDLLRGAEWLLLAVRDDAIEEVAHRLAAARGRASGTAGARVALHLAGARTRDALAPLADRGLDCGVFHPVVALADGDSAARLRGATATISGDPEARGAGRRLAEALGMIPLEIDDAARPLVHAACVMAAGDVVSLLGLAEELLDRAGVPLRDARRLVGALAGSAVEGYRALGAVAGLTGPVARGDAGTVARHREALDGAAPAAGAAHGPLLEAALRRLVSAGRLTPDDAARLARAAGLPDAGPAGTTRSGPASPRKPDRPRSDDR